MTHPFKPGDFLARVDAMPEPEAPDPAPDWVTLTDVTIPALSLRLSHLHIDLTAVSAWGQYASPDTAGPIPE